MKREARGDLRNLHSRHKCLVQAIQALENLQKLRPVDDSGHEMAKLPARRDGGVFSREWVGSR